MGYSIGIDANGRDIGYGVPAECDHPECKEQIDRGISYLCECCKLYFCVGHLNYSVKRDRDICYRCIRGNKPVEPKPDINLWVNFKLTDPSWAKWREQNQDWVKEHSNAS